MGQSLSSMTIKNIDGVDVNLSSYTGSKILFFIAPVNAADSMRLYDIDSFVTAYGNKIQLIGIMSYEDGYIDSNKAAIKALYQQSWGFNFTLTEGMHTKKAAGANQSDLCKWLTSKTLNGKFNTDCKGICQKFFIQTDGTIYSILPAEIPFISGFVTNSVNRVLVSH